MSLRRVKLRSPSVVLQAKTSGQLSLAPAPRVLTKHAWFSNAGMSTNVGSSPAASPLSFFQRWNMASVKSLTSLSSMFPAKLSTFPSPPDSSPPRWSLGRLLRWRAEEREAARLPLRYGRTLGVGKDPECPPGA